VFTIPVADGEYLVYAPLRRAAFVANPRAVNVLADLADGRYVAEADPGGAVWELCRRLEIADAGDEPRPESGATGAPAPTELTLLLTTNCNLRCTYCYASSGARPGKSMPLAVAKRGIDFVASNATAGGCEFFSIAYHGGGEPTVHWSVLVASLEYARGRANQLGLSLTAAAATNGMLREEQVDWIVEHLNGGVSVSFDGLPENQDENRLTVSGEASSPHVIRTLRRFDEREYGYGIRLTVTHRQIDQLADSIEYICGNFRPQRIQVEPVYQLGRWSDAPSAETRQFVESFREARARAASFGQRIEFSAARLERLSDHFCDATQNLFALTPDGNVTSCYEVFAEDGPLAETFFYGRPDPASDGYLFDLAVVEQLRQQTVTRREFCRGCFAKWHCSGDCYHKALVASKGGELTGTNRCHITRELIKDDLLERIAAAGGIFWHEPPEAGPAGEVQHNRLAESS
jgi:uncharacterized protein